MTLLKLALRNIFGAGLRTWLNVFVLSFAFVAIIWLQGFNEGIREQVSNSLIDFEYGGGQFWHAEYDPFDPLSLSDAHAKIPADLQAKIDQKNALAISVAQATLYPQGRIHLIILKGIDPEQQILEIPTRFLASDDGEINALIGTRMARSAKLEIGDYVTLRWRDANGTFDARDIRIAQIMQTDVQSIDAGQVWISLASMRKMTAMPAEATIIVMGESLQAPPAAAGWQWKSQAALLQDITDLVRVRSMSSAIFYFILLLLAMLAIFDTQVLSIFRRRKEIGTLIALGMTRGEVIKLFTIEGFLNGVLAAVVGAAYGIPLFTYFAGNGVPIPQSSSEGFGIAMGQILYPQYSSALILGTMTIVLVTVLIVSYLPARKISKMKPTDALRGRLA